MDIIWKGSPNFLKRTKPIKKIVIHWFGKGTLESANNRFQNTNNQVSAHYGISKGRVWQWVKENNIAYHSGNFTVNAESIGIEHDATTDHYLSEQDYRLSAQLVLEIAQRYNIPLDRQYIISHREIKPTQCSGTIDINKIINLAKNMNDQIIIQAKGAERRIVLKCSTEQQFIELCKVYGKDPNKQDENVKDI